jgi:hypothetical protein
MGSQLQWLDGATRPPADLQRSARAKVARYPGFGACHRGCGQRARRSCPMPVYVVAPSSAWALSVDYRRLYVTHETIGYSEPGQPFELPLAPADDGIWRMDIATGGAQLLVSYAISRAFHPQGLDGQGDPLGQPHRDQPASSRILFLHRWTERVKDETCFLHRLITMNPDGSAACACWNARTTRCRSWPKTSTPAPWARSTTRSPSIRSRTRCGAMTITSSSGARTAARSTTTCITTPRAALLQVVGKDVLTENGHMTFSPVNKRWLL